MPRHKGRSRPRLDSLDLPSRSAAQGSAFRLRPPQTHSQPQAPAAPPPRRQPPNAAIQTGSRYANMPSLPPSRPYPDSRYPPKPPRRVEQVRRIHPHDAGLHLRRYIQRHVDVLAPDAQAASPKARVVRKLHGLCRRAERHCYKHRTKDLLLCHSARRRHAGQQRRLKETAPCSGSVRSGCQHVAPSAHAPVSTYRRIRSILHLYPRSPRGQSPYPVASPTRSVCIRARILSYSRLGHALLHQHAADPAQQTCPLVKPDPIDQSFNRGVKIRIVEHDVRRLPTQLQAQLLRRCLP